MITNETVTEVSAVVIHHRPKVEKRRVYWWSKCHCGHAQHYISWRRAFIDALIHSDTLK